MQQRRYALGRGVLDVGTRVAVRNRYQGWWGNGFEIAERTDDGYRVRRESDGYVLPGDFSAHDVRRRG